jgi:Tfp pilus assembly protein PilV
MKICHRNNHSQCSLLRTRKGFSILEAFVSMILISATVSIAIPALRVVNLQRKSIDQQLSATTALANLGERIAANNSWHSLTPMRLERYQTEMLKQLNLTEPQLSVNLMQSEKEPTKRQIQIQLSWKNPYGEWVDPLRLSLWFHQERSSNESK